MSEMTGLALGGGGSRALCHLGVLKVLAEEGIKIDCIAGSSLGGMIAAMYAFNPDAAALHERGVEYFSGSRLFAEAVSESQDPSQAQSKSFKHRMFQATFLSRFFFTLLRRPSLLLHNPIMEAATELLPESDISAAEIPLACNALDMTLGKLRTFRTGDVRRAVVAGTSIASILPPYEWDGVIYADAAPVCAVPVRAARELGAGKVIAVDLRAPVERQDKFANGFEVFRRIEATSSRLLNDAEVAGADVVIRPEKVLDIFWADFTDVGKIVKIGEDATRATLTEIKEML